MTSPDLKKPQWSRCHYQHTLDEYTVNNSKQTLIHGQDIGQLLQRTPLTRLPPGHNSIRSQTMSQALHHNAPNASRWPKH